MGQRQAATRQVVALGIEQAQTQGLQRAGPGVVGCTAADSQDHPAGTGVQGSLDQFASTEGAGDAGIALLRLEQLQAAGFGHFDDGCVAVRQPAPMGLDRRAQRALHMIAAQLAITGGDDRLDCAFTTIGHRAFDQLRVGHDISQTGSDRIGDFFGTQTVFERVGGNHDFHGAHLQFLCHPCCQ